MSFRENFLRLRAESGYTQEDIAQRLDVSRQSVAKWEAGKSTPDLDKLIVLSDLFDVSLDELVRGKATLPKQEQMRAFAQQTSEVPNEPVVETTFGNAFDETDSPSLEESSFDSTTSGDPLTKDAYLAHMISFARKMGAGVGFIILGAAFSVLASFLASIVEGYADLLIEPLGGISIIAFCAVGLAFLIPAGIGHGDFQKRHPVLDFEFSDEDLDESRRVLVTHITLGIVLIFIGVIVVIAVSVFGEDWDELGAFILIVCVAIGVEELIYGGIRGSATEKREYETNAAEALLDSSRSLPDELDPVAAAKAQRTHIVSAICGIVMIIATIVGLGMLLIGGVPLFWLAWPIGGLTCGIVSLAGDALLASRVG